MVVLKWLLSICIVLCAVTMIPELYDRVSMPRHIAWCAMTLLMVLCTRKVQVGKVHIFAIGFLICALFSGIFAVNKSEWVYSVLRIVLMISFLSVIVIDEKLLAKTMILLGIVFTVYFWWELYYVGDLVEVRGLMRQKNWWAAAHFFVLPFCYYAHEKKFWRISYLVAISMVLNIILLHSRTAMLGVVVCVVFLLAYKRMWKTILISAIGIVLSTIWVEVSTLSLFYRYEQWYYTLGMIKDYPLGVGAGNWWIMFPKYAIGITHPGAFYKEMYRFPHNDFIWICAEIGFVGLICYIGMLAMAFRKKYIYVVLGLMGHAVMSCFTALYERPFSTMMLIIFIAIACNRQPVNQPRILISLLIFILVVFGFRCKASYWNKRLKIDYRNMDYSVRGYSPFSTLTSNGVPWKFFSGVLNFEDKRIPLAIRQLDLSYKHNPHSVFAINGKGLSCVMQGATLTAKDYFQEAVVMCPDFVEARENLERVTK